MKILYPDLMLSCTSELNTAILHHRGIRGIILDMDNTLAPWGASVMGESVCRWVEELKDEGFRLFIVSNSLPSKGESLAKEVGVEAVWRAVKPRAKAFRHALKQMNLRADETAVIGDQIFTDVLGGNRLGMFTILVPPLHEKDFIWTKVMRIFEKRVFKKMQQEGIYSTGRDI